MDYFNKRVPYWEKKGTLIYWPMGMGDQCVYQNLTEKAKSVLKKALATHEPNDDVAILTSWTTIHYAGCKTVSQVSLSHNVSIICLHLFRVLLLLKHFLVK
jgi:hypothetical protein